MGRAIHGTRSGPSGAGCGRATTLEARQSADSFCFHALIGPTGREVLVFFRPSAGPFDHQTIDLVSLSQPEGYRQFRLRQITGPAFDQA